MKRFLFVVFEFVQVTYTSNTEPVGFVNLNFFGYGD